MNAHLNRLLERAIQVNRLSWGKYKLELDLSNESGRGELIDLETNKPRLKWETTEEGSEKLRGVIDALSNTTLTLEFLFKLRDGGAIVSSNDCSELEIADARATSRFYVDPEGFGYVCRTQEWLHGVQSKVK